MKKKKGKKLDKWFLLTWKKILIIAGAFFLFTILHNVFYALSEISGKNLAIGEVFFFLIAVIIVPLYFLVCFIYTGFIMIKTKEAFKKEFIISTLIAIIIGAIAILLIIKFNFINPEMGFMLTVIFIIFAFIFYYVIKSFKN